MSLKALSWAVEQELKPTQKLVLLMLANRHNGDTGQCNPSHTKLAKDCGLAVSGTKKAIKELVELGFLTIRFSSKDGVSLPNQYVLNFKNAPLKNDDEGVGHEVTVGHKTTGGGSRCDRGVGHEVATKQEVETVKETVKNITRKKPDVKETTFAQYLTNCKAENVQAIPAESEPYSVADRLSLDDDMLTVAWLEFKTRHLDENSSSSKKKQKDWIKTFANYVRNNFLKIWYVHEGQMLWSNEGKSLRAFHLVDEVAA